MARGRGFLGRIADFFGFGKSEPEREPSRPSEPIRQPRPEPGGFFPPEQHHTWADVESQAYANIADGESYDDSDLRDAYNTLRELYGDGQEALDKLHELLVKQSRAFDSYAIGLDPGPGQDLWDQVQQLNLPSSIGRYHGNTETGRHHFYGRRAG